MLSPQRGPISSQGYQPQGPVPAQFPEGTGPEVLRYQTYHAPTEQPRGAAGGPRFQQRPMGPQGAPAAPQGPSGLQQALGVGQGALGFGQQALRFGQGTGLLGPQAGLSRTLGGLGGAFGLAQAFGGQGTPAQRAIQGAQGATSIASALGTNIPYAGPLLGLAGIGTAPTGAASGQAVNALVGQVAAMANPALGLMALPAAVSGFVGAKQRADEIRFQQKQTKRILGSYEPGNIQQLVAGIKAGDRSPEFLKELGRATEAANYTRSRLGRQDSSNPVVQKILQQLSQAAQAAGGPWEQAAQQGALRGVAWQGPGGQAVGNQLPMSSWERTGVPGMFSLTPQQLWGYQRPFSPGGPSPELMARFSPPEQQAMAKAYNMRGQGPAAGPMISGMWGTSPAYTSRGPYG